MVEQNVALSLEMADYAYILENGRIVGMGEAARLRESEQVKNAYLGLGDA
jgi:branched-chain amino acid transport system ATP-binding protein